MTPKVHAASDDPMSVLAHVQEAYYLLHRNRGQEQAHLEILRVFDFHGFPGQPVSVGFRLDQSHTGKPVFLHKRMDLEYLVDPNLDTYCRDAFVAEHAPRILSLLGEEATPLLLVRCIETLRRQPSSDPATVVAAARQLHADLVAAANANG